LKLYGYFRSSAAYRVRIALGLKGVRYVPVSVDLVAGDQRDADYTSRNPLGLVPALEDDGRVLGQSLAIIEYLEERYPEPPLLPADAWARAQARSIAYAIACDTHPLNNLSVLNFLRDELGVDQAGRDAWYARWIDRSFKAIEAVLVAGPFAVGSQPTIADTCLVPQVFNARRFDIDLTPYPKITAVDAAMVALPAVAAAHPSRQTDAR